MYAIKLNVCFYGKYTCLFQNFCSLKEAVKENFRAN